MLSPPTAAVRLRDDLLCLSCMVLLLKWVSIREESSSDSVLTISITSTFANRDIDMNKNQWYESTEH